MLRHNRILLWLVITAVIRKRHGALANRHTHFFAVHFLNIYRITRRKVCITLGAGDVAIAIFVKSLEVLELRLRIGSVLCDHLL